MKLSDLAVCNLCNREGNITVLQRNGKTIVRDYISHLTSCPRHPKKSPKHFAKRKWEKQEKIANDLVGASATIASGAMNKDGDGRRLFEWRVESKQTEAHSYRLYWDVWNELIFKCKVAAELPLLHIQINGKRYCGVHPVWLLENIMIEKWDVAPPSTYDGQKIMDFGTIKQKSFLLKENLFSRPNVQINIYRNPSGEDLCIITEYLFKELTKNV